MIDRVKYEKILADTDPHCILALSPAELAVMHSMIVLVQGQISAGMELDKREMQAFLTLGARFAIVYHENDLCVDSGCEYEKGADPT